MVDTPLFLFIKATLQSSPKKSSSFCLQSSQQSTQKIFSLPQPFRQFRLPQGTREQVSLVRTDTVLISPFFSKYGQWQQGSQSLILYHSVSKNWCFKIVGNHPIHLFSYPQPIAITSIPYKYHHRKSHSPGNKFLDLIFTLVLAFSHTNQPPPPHPYPPRTLEFGHSNNPKDLYTKTKTCE